LDKFPEGKYSKKVKELKKLHKNYKTSYEQALVCSLKDVNSFINYLNAYAAVVNEFGIMHYDIDYKKVMERIKKQNVVVQSHGYINLYPYSEIEFKREKLLFFDKVLWHPLPDNPDKSYNAGFFYSPSALVGVPHNYQFCPDGWHLPNEKEISYYVKSMTKKYGTEAAYQKYIGYNEYNGSKARFLIINKKGNGFDIASFYSWTTRSVGSLEEFLKKGPDASIVCKCVKKVN
jgi:uncharacterized protein (TIGR02145 family)